MTNKEKLVLESIAKRIEELASLEDCCCETREDFRIYMQQFDCCAVFLREVVKYVGWRDSFVKREELDFIIRMFS